MVVNPTDLYYRYRIHYSIKLNGCFVLQRDTVYDMKYKGPGIVPYQLTVMVVDIHADDSVANYSANYHPSVVWP